MTSQADNTNNQLAIRLKYANKLLSDILTMFNETGEKSECILIPFGGFVLDTIIQNNVDFNDIDIAITYGNKANLCNNQFIYKFCQSGQFWNRVIHYLTKLRYRLKFQKIEIVVENKTQESNSYAFMFDDNKLARHIITINSVFEGDTEITFTKPIQLDFTSHGKIKNFISGVHHDFINTQFYMYQGINIRGHNLHDDLLHYDIFTNIQKIKNYEIIPFPQQAMISYLGCKFEYFNRIIIRYEKLFKKGYRVNLDILDNWFNIRNSTMVIHPFTKDDKKIAKLINDDKCLICHSDFENEELLVIVRCCKKVFHVNCIKENIQCLLKLSNKNNHKFNCPNCRNPNPLVS